MASQSANVSVGQVSTGRTGSSPTMTWTDSDDNVTYSSRSGDIDAIANVCPSSVTWDPANGETLKGAFESAMSTALAPLGLTVLVYRSEHISTTWQTSGGGFYAHALDSGEVVVEKKGAVWMVLSVHVQ